MVATASVTGSNWPAAHIYYIFVPDLIYDFQGLPEQNDALLCVRLHGALADHTKTSQYGLHIMEITCLDRLRWRG